MDDMRRMTPARWGYSIARWLRVVVALMVAFFAASTLYAAWRSRYVDAELAQLRTNALPSITVLGAARADLRRIHIVATEATMVRYDRATKAREVRAAREALDADLLHYLELPAYDRERRRFIEMNELLGQLDARVGDLSSDDAANAGTALAEIGALVDRIDVVVQDLVELNAVEATEAAARIERLRREMQIGALLLDFIAVGIAVAAAVAAGRAARRVVELAIEQERAAELETFAQRVAHDLLSPLSSLTYSIATMRRYGNDPERVSEAGDRALASVRRAQKMVNGIFEFARAGGKPEPDASCSVAEVASGVLDDARETDADDAPSIHVAVDEDVFVACSSGVLTSILANLVGNAVKHTRGLGEPRIEVRAQERASRVLIEVEDAGPGLEPSFVDAAFEPYARGANAAGPGMGLGLATVRKLAVAHGGRAGYRRAPSGSVFWVELPAASRPPAVRAEPRSVMH